MIDYSRAASSKAANESFQNQAEALKKEIQDLQNQYQIEWDNIEELRKGRAAIIENLIPILKDNGIKLAKPLSRCNHEELMSELKEASNTLPYSAKEEVEVAMVRIDGRYNQIVEQGKKLDELYEKLSKFYIVEKDYDQEVIVSLEEYKKSHQSKKKDENKTKPSISDDKQDIEESKDKELEKVEQIEQGDQEVVSSLDELINHKLNFGEEKEPEIIEEENLTLFNEFDNELDFDEAFDSVFADENNDLDNGDDIQKMNEFLLNEQNNLEEEQDYQIYGLKDDQTLAKIVEYVYGGNLSWYDIYRYGNNQGMIDRKCAEAKIDPEDAAYKEGVLTDLPLEYPKNFIMYEEIKNEDVGRGMSRAA